ncbi:7,8-dihydropteroate synthase [uncultured Desulfobacterium sp.]|uniref:Dihydropteroate synthase n=1 Tax=uncultured Desulfobacterium sp. TaxID=201089 RepID=A0A445MX01_9BACT|nr:7,8-dihydropteroate synthase [uncultured Desulfobacterium sp.]
MHPSLSWLGHTLNLGQRTHVMGILNVTPDSFSDGGRYLEEEKAVAHGIKMAVDGADIIDVGGESTRPFSKKISVDEEVDRVIPVIEALSGQISIPISIDTYKAAVAREAIKAGAVIINDISALRFDPDMVSVAADSEVPLVLMHMKGTPENMQENPVYSDVIAEIVGFLNSASEAAVKAGVKEEMIILDPGIGFGKTLNHNLQIIRGLNRFLEAGRPIMLGVSNKAFLGQILDAGPHQRDVGTMAAIACAVINGANIVRVHNVKKAADTVRVADAIKRGYI